MGFNEGVDGELRDISHGFSVERVGNGVTHAENALGIGGFHTFVGHFQSMGGTFEQSFCGRCKPLSAMCESM